MTPPLVRTFEISIEQPLRDSITLLAPDSVTAKRLALARCASDRCLDDCGTPTGLFARTSITNHSRHEEPRP